MSRSRKPRTIGERIHAIRVARGLSQRDIAAPGCSYAYVSRLERDERVPSGKALALLSSSLGVSEHWIVTGRDEVILPPLSLDVALELRACVEPQVPAVELFLELLGEAIAKVPR